MITLKDLQEEWKSDCKIDDLDLGSESLKTPELHSKYLNHLSNFKLHLRKKEAEYLTLRRNKWRWYRGEMSAEKLEELGWEQYLGNTPLKNEMNDFIDSDPDVIKVMDHYEYVKTCVFQCETIMRSINSRTWDIKNAVEYTKFTNGLM